MRGAAIISIGQRDEHRSRLRCQLQSPNHDECDHQCAGPQDYVFGEEYAAIYWLEQNGYNLNYISGIDAATNGSLLLNSKTYMDVGHDEYWSQSQLANVKAAADAGVGLAFLSGNQTYWDVALAPSLDVNQTPNRTIVEYKDIWSGAQLDPNGTTNGGTGMFRDPVYGPGTPENGIVRDDLHGRGLIQSLHNISVPASMSQLRFWANTSIASGKWRNAHQLLGYEYDSDLDNGFRPTGSDRSFQNNRKRWDAPARQWA